MSPITARSRKAFRRAHAETPRTHMHSHRTDVVKAGNYYAGATQPRARSLRSRDPAGQSRLVPVMFFGTTHRPVSHGATAVAARLSWLL